MISFPTARPGMVSLVVSEAWVCFTLHLFEEPRVLLLSLVLIFNLAACGLNSAFSSCKKKKLIIIGTVLVSRVGCSI